MVGYKSDVGVRRKFNEDNLGYFENDSYSLYIVADGMGGHNAGEVASKMAVETVTNYVNRNIEDEGEDTLKNAIENVNVKIYNYSISNLDLRGMGTTITACLCYEGKVIIANVGDSSCFGIKNEKIYKLTKDHSLVQQLLDAGSISEEEAKNHPNKNIITRAVGTSEDVDVDIFIFDISDFDRYLICSDGLTNEVTLEEINDILKREKNNESACEMLINEANKNGGRDNITVMLFGGEIV
ncbi:protein phosphatase [Clostridium baratii]|uniref:Stp1/IreP family PP2C-type Ser/Thr phosphatase n=1 Tax=Clostridium baratii TaxID=1561 RepID=UPI0009A4290E|nr:Stp1/IreP family PP2C-type Ser/Thr phosphatase [Clostridium baratii]OPF52021.1 protein phosphatase [Clostridium baratii]OPF53645.1 protein phosphatase [Clostridium baratii]OPF57765.1 protein phosphatase [Clostridium baratii]OPF60739.1 protein phosphatase [Clostridium baratii]